MGVAEPVPARGLHPSETTAHAVRFLFDACEKSVNKINNKCAKRARRDYGSLMHQSPGVPVATARLMDARIAALAALLEAASLPRERERLRALLSALQTAVAARHGPTSDDKDSREKYAFRRLSRDSNAPHR